MIARLEKAVASASTDGSEDEIAAAIRTAAAGDLLAEALLVTVRAAHIEGADAEFRLRAALARLPPPPA
jgi:hypothetical protein